MKILLLLITALSLMAGEYTKMKDAFDHGDLSRAINIARTNAMRGSIPAMYDLGLLYYAKGSSKEAKTWLERSVKNDGKGAMGVAIIAFAQAQHPKEYESVMDLLINVPKSAMRDALMAVSRDLAHNRDEASASQYLLLAELYYYDKIVHPNLRIALYLTKQAARKGDPKAKEMMGDAYWRSNYTVDTLMVAPHTGNALNIALEYYRDASALGNYNAMAKLGKLHIIGPRNLRRSDYGVELILKAAEAGSAVGALMAAELYANGVVIRRNPQQALAWYKKASSICNVNKILAHHYRSGEEAEKYAQAFKKCSQEASSKRSYHILFEKF